MPTKPSPPPNIDPAWMETAVIGETVSPPEEEQGETLASLAFATEDLGELPQMTLQIIAAIGMCTAMLIPFNALGWYMGLSLQVTLQFELLTTILATCIMSIYIRPFFFWGVPILLAGLLGGIAFPLYWFEANGLGFIGLYLLLIWAELRAETPPSHITSSPRPS